MPVAGLYENHLSASGFKGHHDLCMVCAIEKHTAQTALSGYSGQLEIGVFRDSMCVMQRKTFRLAQEKTR
jgi:hypothetical protein